jgi:hypothetical protein
VSRPAAAKAALIPAGDFTWAIGSPTIGTNRVAPLSSNPMSVSWFRDRPAPDRSATPAVARPRRRCIALIKQNIIQ